MRSCGSLNMYFLIKKSLSLGALTPGFPTCVQDQLGDIEVLGEFEVTYIPRCCIEPYMRSPAYV